MDRLLELHADTPQEALIRRAQTGDARAREQLVASNMPLVYHIARRYRCRSLTMEDLAQEGAIGLLCAIDSFDAGEGTRLSTYATLCIRSAIHRAVAQKDRMVRLPTPRLRDRERLRKAAEPLRHRLQREPTLTERAVACSLLPELAERLLAGEPVSLDAPAAAAGESPLAEVLADPQAVDPEEAAIR